MLSSEESKSKGNNILKWDLSLSQTHTASTIIAGWNVEFNGSLPYFILFPVLSTKQVKRAAGKVRGEKEGTKR